MAETREGMCELCGYRMPPGEAMFRFHGYSGPCPGPLAAPAGEPPPPPADEGPEYWCCHCDLPLADLAATHAHTRDGHAVYALTPRLRAALRRHP